MHRNFRILHLFLPGRDLPCQHSGYLCRNYEYPPLYRKAHRAAAAKQNGHTSGLGRICQFFYQSDHFFHGYQFKYQHNPQQSEPKTSVQFRQRIFCHHRCFVFQHHYHDNSWLRRYYPTYAFSPFYCSIGMPDQLYHTRHNDWHYHKRNQFEKKQAAL